MSAASEPFVQDLLDALGLDPDTTHRLQIDIPAGCRAVITVTSYAKEGWPTKLVNRYRLAPMNPDGPDDENIGGF